MKDILLFFLFINVMFFCIEAISKAYKDYRKAKLENKQLKAKL